MRGEGSKRKKKKTETKREAICRSMGMMRKMRDNQKEEKGQRQPR